MTCGDGLFFQSTAFPVFGDSEVSGRRFLPERFLPLFPWFKQSAHLASAVWLGHHHSLQAITEGPAEKVASLIVGVPGVQAVLRCKGVLALLRIVGGSE